MSPNAGAADLQIYNQRRAMELIACRVCGAAAYVGESRQCMVCTCLVHVGCSFQTEHGEVCRLCWAGHREVRRREASGRLAQTVLNQGQELGHVVGAAVALGPAVMRTVVGAASAGARQVMNVAQAASSSARVVPPLGEEPANSQQGHRETEEEELRAMIQEQEAAALETSHRLDVLRRRLAGVSSRAATSGEASAESPMVDFEEVEEEREAHETQAGSSHHTPRPSGPANLASEDVLPAETGNHACGAQVVPPVPGSGALQPTEEQTSSLPTAVLPPGSRFPSELYGLDPYEALERLHDTGRGATGAQAALPFMMPGTFGLSGHPAPPSQGPQGSGLRSPPGLPGMGAGGRDPPGPPRPTVSENLLGAPRTLRGSEGISESARTALRKYREKEFPKLTFGDGSRGARLEDWLLRVEMEMESIQFEVGVW